MNSLEDLIFETDLSRLPKVAMGQLAETCGFDKTATMETMMDLVWPATQGEEKKKLQSAVSYAFGGRVAVSWYFMDPSKISSAIDRLAKAHPSVFAETHIPDEEHMVLGKVYVTGGVKISSDFHVIRLLTLLRKTRDTNGSRFRTLPVISDCLVIFSTKDRVIEIRTSNKAKHKFEEYLADLLSIPNDQLNPTQMASFANNLDAMAVALGGAVGPVSSKPGEGLEPLTPKEREQLIGMLHSLSEYLISGDSEELLIQLQEVRNALEGSKFREYHIAVLLAGTLSKIAMKPNKEEDTRDSLIYCLLRSAVEHQGGDITFPVKELDGNTSTHTIGIGLTSNSIYFKSKASELAILKVRKVILNKAELAEDWNCLLGGVASEVRTA